MARNAPVYCEEGDLLIGDLALGPAYSKIEFINAAADEMDSRIGVRYALPLPAAGSMSTVTVLILKRINAHLASGRLIMAVATASQDDSLHAYGKYLVDQALNDLFQIQSGEMPLENTDGNLLPTVGSESAVEGPTILNRDEQSGVDTFYEEFGFGTVWAPGART